MKTFIYFISLIGVVLFTPVSSASIWSWIDNLKVCESPGLKYCYEYNFVIAEWDDDDPAPNPCYGSNACTMFIGHRHDNAGLSGPEFVRAWDASKYPFLIELKTMGEVAKSIKEIFPLPFSSETIHRGNETSPTECVGIFHAVGKNLGNYTAPLDNYYFQGHPLLPGSVCGAAPAPSGQCDFVNSTLTLDHGILSQNQLEGHEVSDNTEIQCTTAQTLKLFIYSADNVKLNDDGSLYSELYMNNNSLGIDGITIEVKDKTSVNIKSVLRTNGKVPGGEFNGSTVMLITIE